MIKDEIIEITQLYVDMCCVIGLDVKLQNDDKITAVEKVSKIDSCSFVYNLIQILYYENSFKVHFSLQTKVDDDLNAIINIENLIKDEYNFSRTNDYKGLFEFKFKYDELEKYRQLLSEVI